ncbi:MAG: hypothetical protein ACLFUS_13725, partial [Candidatus Sumerlaeia bacterium]
MCQKKRTAGILPVENRTAGILPVENRIAGILPAQWLLTKLPIPTSPFHPPSIPHCHQDGGDTYRRHLAGRKSYRRHLAGTMASDKITNPDFPFFIHPPFPTATKMVAIRTAGILPVENRIAGILPAQWLPTKLPIPTS